MSQKKNKKIPSNPSSYIDILVGSVVKQIAVVVYTLFRKCNVDPKWLIHHLFFDWQSKIGCNFDGMLDVDIESFYGPEDFIEAHIPNDNESMQKAEENGDFWPMNKGWYLNPGPILDNIGACGDPRLGLVLALVNRRVIKRRIRKIIQKIREHAREDELTIKDIDSGGATRVVIKLQCSTVGATGSGSMPYFLSEDGIRACAKEDGVEANLILQVICRGNLETTDNERSDFNEFLCLKHIHVLNSGGYLSPLTAKIQPVASDALYVSSNQNNNGNITSLDQFVIHQGHCDYFLYHSKAGEIARERLTDIMAPEYDRYGDPLNVLTMSCAILSRDSSRVLEFCSNKAIPLLVKAIASEGDINRIRRLAVGLARENNIVESEQENQISKIIMHPDDFGCQNVVDGARASFVDRINSVGGIEKAVVADDSLKSILNSDISEIYKPCMGRQAQLHVKGVISAIEGRLKQIMRTFCGLWEVQKLYAFLKIIAEKSLQALMEKIKELQEFLQPHDQIIAEASEQTDRLQKSNWLIRMVNLPLINRLAYSLETSGIAAISYQLQIAACEIAVNNVLMPLIDYLDRKGMWLSVMNHKLAQVSQICENKANSIAAKPTILKVPLGIELTTPEYLDNYFQDYVKKQGGEDKFAACLLNHLLQKYGSLAFLADASVEEYEEVFTNVCEKFLLPDIESTDVVSEFKRIYPDRNKQRRIIRQLIKQSEGRLRITGEVNKSVSWLKAANVPSAEYADWLREILMSVDKKQGKWEVAVHNDPDQIVIGQLRGGISLQPFIKRVAPPANLEGWAKMVTYAPDPVSVLIVMPNPNRIQFRRVLAKAIVNGQITIGEDGCYVLSSSSGQQLVLGKTFESVETALQPKWPELVFIESTFGSKLVISEEHIISKLNAIKEDIQSNKPVTDPLLSLIDLTAVDECLIQADLMLPRLRRIRKANQKRLAS